MVSECYDAGKENPLTTVFVVYKFLRMIQGWLFLNELSFWTEPRVEAFVTAVPIVSLVYLR